MWIRTSLFVGRSHWSYLLQNGIKVFIEQQSIASLTNAILIEFNYISGENVRFAVNVLEDHAETFSIEIDTFFKNFFSYSVLPVKELCLPIDGLFLPCQSNSIQYGLYTQYLPGLEEPITKIISQTTLAITQAIDEISIDEEVLTMLGFYFYCGLITLAKEQSSSDFTELYSFNAEENDQISKLTMDFLSERYLDNEPTLIEVEKSIRHYQLIETYENPRWLVEWMMVCKATLNNHSDDDPELLFNISNCIKLQLGLTNGMVKLVHYFVNKIYQNTPC